MDIVLWTSEEQSCCIVYRHVGVKVFFMSGDRNEVKEYLRYLLDHNAECRKEGCASCQTLNNVCEQLRFHIFSGPVYPEVMTSATSHALSLH